MEIVTRTALVTGGSRGIGRAVCLELAKRGCNVVLCYAGSRDAAEQTADACRALGAQSACVQCDVANAAQVQAMIDSVAQQFGGVDILVNNAGITRDGLLMRMSEEDFDTVVNTNLKGAFLCTKAVSRLMMRRRYGRIINISSVVGLHGNAGQANYAASKAGIIGLTKSAAKELASRGVTVNAIAPGFIETDMTSALPEKVIEAIMPTIPADRLGQPEDVARAVGFLASDQAAYITGQVLAVDGGMSM